MDKKLYNEERKREFLKTNNEVEALFTPITEVEEMLGKDFCNFSKDEVLFTIETSQPSYISSLLKQKTRLGAYNNWCIQKGYCTDNNLSDITSRTLNKVLAKGNLKRQTISREDFLLKTKQITTARMRYALLMIFEVGCQNQFADVIHAKADNIIGNSLLLEDRTVFISDELKKYINEAIEEDSVPWKGTTRRLYDVGYILKDYYATDTSNDPKAIYKRTYAQIKKVLVDIDLDFSPFEISLSGIIHMIYSIVKETGNIPYKIITTNLFDQIKKQYNIKISGEKFWEQYKNFFID